MDGETATRQLFEKVVTGMNIEPSDLSRTITDAYDNTHIEAMWIGWKAATFTLARLGVTK